jgi:hypothetical protein
LQFTNVLDVGLEILHSEILVNFPTLKQLEDIQFDSSIQTHKQGMPTTLNWFLQGKIAFVLSSVEFVSPKSMCLLSLLITWISEIATCLIIVQ